MLIRKPEDAIASLLIWDASLSLSIALQSYQFFYSRLLKHKDDLLLIPFEAVTASPFAVIEEANKKFGTTFNSSVMEEQKMSEFKSNLSSKWNSTLKSPLPNQKKEKMKPDLIIKIRNHKLYQKTIGIYNQWMVS